MPADSSGNVLLQKLWPFTANCCRTLNGFFVDCDSKGFQKTLILSRKPDFAGHNFLRLFAAFNIGAFFAFFTGAASTSCSPPTVCARSL